MVPISNPRLLFNKVPKGYPVPGETTVIDESERIDVDGPLNGGALIKVLVLSIDPYMRGRMREPDVKSYAPPFTKGKPLDNFGIGIVLRSENSQIKAGQHFYGNFEFQAYVIKHDFSEIMILENKEKLPWSVYLGVLGMPGQTAYIGWKLYAKAKKGETVFVSTAAGQVGSVVVQIAKSQGLKVIASAGTEEKCAFVKELGADVVFNYKTKDTKEALQELGHGIDIYWDNVGGPMLETAIDAANNYSRIIICGAISGYNTSEPYGVKNLHLVLGKRMALQGFIVLDLLKEWLPEFYEVFPPKVTNGEIKHREQVYHGFKGAEQALLDNQTGGNTWKPVVVLADE